IATLVLVSCLPAGPSAFAGLEEYIKRPDPAFSWKAEGPDPAPGGTFYDLELTSQVWQGITWRHWLRVYQPKEGAARHAMLLYMTGRANGDRPSEDDAKTGFGLAQLCGARVAVLYQVPNHPLLDGKSEDELIAETLVRWLDTKDDNWPLLFPMVK